MRLLLASVLCIYSALCLSADPRPITKRSLTGFFDTAFEVQRKDHEIVGALVVVVKDGEVLFKRGYGFADIEAREKADPDRHLFRIASITKPFTWTAVMQQVEQGNLDLDVDVNQYLDFEFPEAFGEPIRLRDLMTHTPGLEERGIGSFIRTEEELLPPSDWLPGHMPDRVRPPGTFVSYSNYGTGIAGYIVERVSGKPWPDYIQENLLDPLGMSDTNVYQPMSDTHKEHHAKGYTYEAGQFVAKPYWFSNNRPAGVISSTAADMAKWMMMHLNLGELDGVRILQEDTAKTMQSELYRAHPDAIPILHGFYRTDRNGVEIFTHGGDVNQFHSNMSLFPEHNLGLFVSFNSDPGASARSNLVPAFVDYFFPDEFPAPVEVNESVNLNEYLGAWTTTRRNHSRFEKLSLLVQTGEINKTSDGGILLSFFGNSSRWYPIENDIFRAKYSPRRMHFHRDDDGEVNYMTFSDGFGAFEKLSFWQSGQTQGALFGLVGLVAFCYVVVALYRLFKPAPTTLSLPDRLAAIVLGGSILFLLYRLYVGLTGNTDDLVFGLPRAIELTFLWSLLTVPLAFYVTYCAIRQWTNNSGSLSLRIKYTLFTASGLLYVFLLWYWNLLSYYF